MPISAALGSSALLPAGLGFRNKIMNGNMVIAQRGTAAITGSSAKQYPVDRWVCQSSTTNSVTFQQSTTAPAGFTNSIVATSGNSATAYTSNNYTFMYQYIEGYNIADLAYGSASAKQVSVSFWCRASQTGTYNAVLENSNATRNYVTTFTVNTANTWEYKTLLISGSPSGTWLTDNGAGLAFYIVLGMGSTYETASPNTWLESSVKYGTSGAVDIGAYNAATFYLTGVQLEQNYQPTPFEQRPYGVELQLCQRYYQRYNNDGGSNTTPLNGGVFVGTGVGAVGGYLIHPVRLRRTLTSSDISYANIGIDDQATFGTGVSSVVVNSSRATLDTTGLFIATTSSVTSKAPNFIVGTSTSPSYIAVSAEL